MEEEKVNCLKCKYYYITYDARMPYGCRLFGFKGRQVPSVSVLQSSGSPCEGFDVKDKQNKA
ncbi:MAG TPA: uracil-DNA glycosylase [Ruminiclostridium sp.]|nr:uracil-DNA glycosylase [Ruminiclostridium sp.]